MPLGKSRATGLATGLCKSQHGPQATPQWSALLSSRRLPQFHLVAFWVNDPAELPVFRVVELVQDVAALFSEDREQRAEVIHSVVDHEGSRARRKRITLGRHDGPGRCTVHRLVVRVCPAKGSAAPVLHVDAEVLLVPGLQRLWVFGLKEDATNSSNTFHVDLTKGEQG